MKNTKTKPRSDIAIHIGNKLKEYRNAKGITQESLANALSVTRVQIHNIETGLTRTTVDKIYVICQIVGCSPSDLFPPIDTNAFVIEEVTVMVPQTKIIIKQKT